MRPLEDLPQYRRFWVRGMTVALLLFSPFLGAKAQISQSIITVTDEDNKFEQVMVEPLELLESLGITPEETQRLLGKRPRILVQGAGFVHDVGLASFTSAQQAKSSIHVVGASFAHHEGLVALAEDPNSEQSESGITITSAGSTRGISLLSPPVE
jgi:hypothetical protein